MHVGSSWAAQGEGCPGMGGQEGSRPSGRWKEGGRHVETAGEKARGSEPQSTHRRRETLWAGAGRDPGCSPPARAPPAR